MILCITRTFANESNIQFYCKNDAGEIRQTVSISSVKGIASHRQGFLQIEQNSNSKPLRSSLLNDNMLDIVDADCDSEIAKKVSYIDDNGMVARVHFDFDSFTLSPLADKTLSDASEHLAANNHTLLVDGHTDSTGTEQYNQGLGLDRAINASEKLFAHGVNRDNVTIQSFGELNPIVSNDTRENRAKNRRAEIYVID